MKEVTREDWKKNPTPRLMWVWDGTEEIKVKRFVVHCITSGFVADAGNGAAVACWEHCAEIEEPKRWSNYELAKWLYEGARCGEFRECKPSTSALIGSSYFYDKNVENEPCDEDIRIRVNGGEWREPYNIPPECISPTPDEIGG